MGPLTPHRHAAGTQVVELGVTEKMVVISILRQPLDI